MKLHDRITIKLPFIYEIKFLKLPLLIRKEKEVGFLFTNLAFMLFREENNLKDGKELQKLTEEKGSSYIALEMIYHAYEAYCMMFKKKQKYNKKQIIRAFSIAGEEKQKEIFSVYYKSNDFGTSKKKVKTEITKK